MKSSEPLIGSSQKLSIKQHRMLYALFICSFNVSTNVNKVCLCTSVATPFEGEIGISETFGIVHSGKKK